MNPAEKGCSCELARHLLVLLVISGVCPAAENERQGHSARTFYVDATEGRDQNDGRSKEQAWQSLARVNTAELQPGDTVRFRSGGVWRGSLIPASGDETAPVTFTSFDRGDKPRILGSLPRNRREDWVQVRDNVWATLPMDYQLGDQLADLRGSRWNHHQEGGARISLVHTEDASGSVVRIVSAGSGSAANHVQIWGPALPAEKGSCLLLKFRARSSQPVRFPGIGILRNGAPWTQFAKSRPTDPPLGSDWKSLQAVLEATESSADGRLHINLGGMLPENTVLEFQPLSIHRATPSIKDPLDVDVGNIIFDGGTACGWKKWSLDQLAQPYDYFYDEAAQRVFLYCPESPAARHRSIELALARHVVNQNGKHHVVYDGLAVMYGAAHGFGGGQTHHLVIRNCDLGYIGGAHQLTNADGKPVRYGNAIEFWGSAHDNLVEGCRIWEVYDAALTNQGRSPDSRQINITYRNNFIRNAEYSFEYWNHPETAVTRNIRFVNNTCVNAGTVWSHAQRPDRNGSHLMFYSNTAATSGIEIKYNIFCGVSDWGSRYSSGWQVLPDMDFNLWYSTTGIMSYWFRQKIASFTEYRQVTGLDAHSQYADPCFADPARGDYRLRPESPARSLRPDGGPVGASMLWE